MVLAYEPPSKLKTPSSDQPCSSSPMRRRFSSVEMVVLPVPESPKNRATSSASPTLAEQCMGRTPCSTGSTKFSTVKMLFFISPAYPDAHTRTTLRSKSSPMKVSELVPSLRVGLEAGDRDDRPLRLEVFQLLGGRAPEELAGEEGV